MGINLQKNIRPGEYTIAVQAKDAVGGQTYEAKFTFTIAGRYEAKVPTSQ